jgi:YfiR/HmsC-like/Gram-negative bacterial TonB protein C-terminal
MRFSDKAEWSPRRPQPRSVLGIGLAFLALQLFAPGQQQNASEDQVKAAYLFNFAKLAEWPRQALPDGSSPLVIGVSGGDEEFLDVLKAVVSGKIIGTRRVVIRPVNAERDMKSCHIVFFRASERKHIEAAVEGLARAGVLLVGEDESFLGQGGMINLVREHGSVRFEVNSDALDRSQIHFSSKILAMAKTGYESPNHESANTTASKSQVEGARRLEHSVPAEYPDIAKRMNLSGIAQVQALVKPDGTVKEVKILGGHPLLADSLARAVMQWKYQAGPKETVEIVKVGFGPQ